MKLFAIIFTAVLLAGTALYFGITANEAQKKSNKESRDFWTKQINDAERLAYVIEDQIQVNPASITDMVPTFTGTSQTLGSAANIKSLTAAERAKALEIKGRIDACIKKLQAITPPA